MDPLFRLATLRAEKATSRPDSPESTPADQLEAADIWEQEREKLLELLAQQQRVAQAGLVTAGLAHDVNNFVQVMSGVSFLALRTDDPSRWRDALETIQEQCLGLSEIARSFQSFVNRKDQAAAGHFKLSNVLEEALRLAGPLAKRHRVEIHTSIENDGTVVGDARLAIQAVVNLTTNAVRACAEIEGGGQVKLVVSRPLPGTCQIRIRDNGPGIPESLRANLFRPFTTGNESAGGNGIGLFIVRQAVIKLGGTIRMRTSPKGTAFSIDLPMA